MPNDKVIHIDLNAPAVGVRFDEILGYAIDHGQWSSLIGHDDYIGEQFVGLPNLGCLC